MKNREEIQNTIMNSWIVQKFLLLLSPFLILPSGQNHHFFTFLKLPAWVAPALGASILFSALLGLEYVLIIQQRALVGFFNIHQFTHKVQLFLTLMLSSYSFVLAWYVTAWSFLKFHPEKRAAPPLAYWMYYVGGLLLLLSVMLWALVGILALELSFWLTVLSSILLLFVLIGFKKFLKNKKDQLYQGLNSKVMFWVYTSETILFAVLFLGILFLTGVL